MKKHWMVYRSDGRGHAPTKAHEEYESAVEEAGRLALRERVTFVVLEAVAVVALEDSPVIVKRIDP